MKDQKKTHGKKPPGTRTTNADGMRGMLRPALVFGLFLALRTVAGFFPAERLWGFNEFAFLPLWIDALLVAAGLAFCTPLLFPAFDAASRFLFPRELKRGGAVPFLVAIGAGILFFVFRMETYFLGDGASYLAEHFRFLRGLPGSEDVLYSKYSAPLTGWLLAMTSKLLDALSGGGAEPLNAQWTFWITGPLAGIAYTAVAWRTASSLKAPGETKWTVFILLLFTAGSVFFFGYVEYYTLLFTALAAFFFAVLRVIDGTARPWTAALLLALATALHFMAVLALPAFVIAVLSRSKSDRLRALLRFRHAAAALALVLAAGLVVYFVSGIAVKGSRVVLGLEPLEAGGRLQTYTLLSPYHLVDSVNLFFLLGAVSLAALAFLLRRDMLDAPDVLAMLVVSKLYGLLAFFGFMGFGMARDWDISAPLGLSLVFLVVAAVRHTAPGVKTRAVLYLAAGSSIVGGLAWFAVNSNERASVDRTRAIFGLDDTHIAGDFALNGYEHLRKYYFSRNDAEGMAWAIGKKIESVGYPTDYRKLVSAAVTDLPPARSDETFAWIFDRLHAKLDSMKDTRARSYAGSFDEFRELAAETLLQYDAAASGRGRPEEAARQFARFDALLPGDPALALAAMQKAWNGTGALADPGGFIAAALSVQHSSTLAFSAGRALVREKRHAEAIALLERSHSLDSTFSLPLLYLGVAEYELSPANAASAIAHIEAFLADPDGHRLSGSPQEDERLTAYARGLLEHLRGGGATRP